MKEELTCEDFKEKNCPYKQSNEKMVSNFVLNAHHFAWRRMGTKWESNEQCTPRKQRKKCSNK